MAFSGGNCIAGIAAAAILGAKVTVTDLPHVLPNIQFNVDANSQVLEKQCGVVDVAALSWGEPGYGGDGKKIAYVMAHLRRWKKESVFFKRAKKLFDIQIMHTEPPSNGSKIGVVVYLFTGKR
ncbi:putative sugar transporter ERD6-like 6-like [Capsicum annuum]|nr:putative sugar transporter ERD6-like 6-like [Capsicum annuum]KAF3653191.1 putative sugar transporter ERD6-like 6-like [Capsicum annuum]